MVGVSEGSGDGTIDGAWVGTGVGIKVGYSRTYVTHTLSVLSREVHSHSVLILAVMLPLETAFLNSVFN